MFRIPRDQESAMGECRSPDDRIGQSQSMLLAQGDRAPRDGGIQLDELKVSQKILAHFAQGRVRAPTRTSIQLMRLMNRLS